MLLGVLLLLLLLTSLLLTSLRLTVLRPLLPRLLLLALLVLLRLRGPLLRLLLITRRALHGVGRFLHLLIRVVDALLSRLRVLALQPLLELLDLLREIA